VEDRALVAAMAGGDPRGLEGAYRRYADRLHAYCRSVLKDADAASDVVHDTFLIASQRAGDLREPDRLQSWLYTIARRECLRVLRASRRGAPLGDTDEPVAEPEDPTRAVQAAQVRELVRAATAGLSDGDREMIELAVRHELSPADVGAILGLSANHAHARMSRARSQLHRSLGALLVARAGGSRCATLNELTRGWDGAFTPLLRKRVSRHIERCARCSERQNELLNPAQLLPAYAAMPFLPVPALVWTRLEAGGNAAAGAAAGPAPSSSPPSASPSSPSASSPSSSSPSSSSPSASSPSPSAPSPSPVSPAAQVPGLPPNSTVHGPPPRPPSPIYASPPTLPLPTSMAHPPWTPADERDGRLKVVAAAVVLALLVLATGAGLLWWRTDAFRPLAEAGATPARSLVAPTADPSQAPVSTESSPDVLIPPVSESPPQPTSTGPLTLTLTLVPFTVTAEDDGGACVASGTYRITVTAESTVQLDTVLLYWQAPDVKRVAMTPTGLRSVKGTTAVLNTSFARWWVEAKSIDGRTAETAPVTVIKVCP
jgi:RNA polymerase sigma factor (sigma-70 family)